MRLIPVIAPAGDTFIRMDTAEALGIIPRQQITQQQYDAAVWED